MKKVEQSEEQEVETRFDMIKRIAEKIQKGLFGPCDFEDERYQDE